MGKREEKQRRAEAVAYFLVGSTAKISLEIQVNFPASFSTRISHTWERLL
jgi:hypothetical protein